MQSEGFRLCEPCPNHACPSPAYQCRPEESNPIVLDHPSFETRTAALFMGHVVPPVWKLSSSARSRTHNEKWSRLTSAIDPASTSLIYLRPPKFHLATQSSLLSVLFSLQRWLRNPQTALCISSTFIPTDDQSWTRRVAILLP